MTIQIIIFTHYLLELIKNMYQAKFLYSQKYVILVTYIHQVTLSCLPSVHKEATETCRSSARGRCPLSTSEASTRIPTDISRSLSFKRTEVSQSQQLIIKPPCRYFDISVHSRCTDQGYRLQLKGDVSADREIIASPLLVNCNL